MTSPTAPFERRQHRTGLPSFIFHPSFHSPTAEREYAPTFEGIDENYDSRHMPDDVTRDHARRMHYAAHRANEAKNVKEIAFWQRHYYTLRDRIVLGNRKLIYRAVRRRLALSNRAEDLIGDCQIVLIQAVAAYNPWLGIRFSTYAYTCLVRALSRMSQRMAGDWLARSLPLDSLPEGEPRKTPEHDTTPTALIRIDEFLREDHPLLSEREKVVISRRFCLSETTDGQTLEKVGKELGLSKERVRQVQASALDKLRKALLDSTKNS